MSGGRLALIVALAVVVLVTLNVIMWRKMKAATAAGRALAERGGGDMEKL